MKMRTRSGGFTILELSVVLLIIALITSMGVYAGLGALESARRASTENKLTEIEKALMAFRTRYNRLPCPTAISITSSTNASYGLESFVNTTVCGGTRVGDYAVRGFVPTRALGLPDEFMYDGWGTKFAYTVDRNAAATDAFKYIRPYESCGVGVLDANLRTRSGLNANTSSIVNASTNSATPAVPVRDTQGAIYALLSYGSTGHGGYQFDSTATVDADLTATAVTLATTGSNSNRFYVQADVTDTADLSVFYDYIVRFKKRSDLMTPDDLINFKNYNGPQLATIDQDGSPDSVKLYRNHCGYWRRVIPIGTYTPAFSNTNTNLTAQFTPKNDLFIYPYSSGNLCRVLTYNSTGASATTAVNSGSGEQITYDNLLTIAGYPSAGTCATCVCNANVASAKFVMAPGNGMMGVIKANDPFIELWNYLPATHNYKYGNSPLGNFIVPISSKLTLAPTAMALSKNADYMILFRSGSYINFYRKISDDPIQYTPITAPTGLSSAANIRAFAFSPDDRFLVVASDNSGFDYDIWYINSADNSFTLLTGLVPVGDATGVPSAVAFSPDGKYAAITTSDSTTTFSENIYLVEPTYSATANTMYFTNQQLFVAGYTNSATVSDYTLNGGSSAPTAALFSPDSSTLILPIGGGGDTDWPLSIFRYAGASQFQPTYVNEMSALYGMVGGVATSGASVYSAAVSK